MEWTDDHPDEDQGSESDLTNRSADLFSRLQEIRKQKKLSLEAISESSRVQLKYLRALEEGDLKRVPEVYDKLFFRSYLKALDLPEEMYYEQFLAYRKSIRLDKTTTVFNFSDRSQVARNKMSPKNLLYLVPIIAVLVLLWILFRNTEFVGSGTPSDVDEIDIREVVADLEAKQVVPIDSDSVAAPDTPALIKLEIKGLKRTWFRVIVDRKDTTEYMLPAGNSMTLQAFERFEFLIGRADGLSMRVNDRFFKLLGPDSTVIQYMLVDSSGIAAKRFLGAG